MQIDNRTRTLKFNKNDVKTFLSNQELKSRSFTREQLESMKNSDKLEYGFNMKKLLHL
jgi:hypothetical protein